MASTDFTILAPAKINLFLHITGKRDDGYHLLQSLIVFVDVGDRLTFAPHDGMFIDIEGPFATELQALRDNLVYKAARALADEYGVPLRGKITLEKNLPTASGMGGGSSDAAATLTGLAKLWGLPEEQDRLLRLAQKLGADVPACLIRKPVWTEGIGEKITRLPEMPTMHLVLANPRAPTQTPEVFSRFDARFSPPIQFIGRRKTLREWIADLKIYRNDLTDAAIGVSPVISTVLQALRDTPNCHFSRLSGSGATCYGVYDNRESALAAVNKLHTAYPRWWIAAASLL